MNVVILFENYGPYHVARFRAAAKWLNVRGIELRSSSADYAWNRQGLADGLEILTVGASSQPAGRETITRQLAQLLRQVPVDAVALPGWADTFALAGLRWCLRQRVPAVLMSESQAIDEVRSAGKEYVKRQVVRSFSAGLAGGKPHGDYLAGLGMLRERIFLGYDAVDNEYFGKHAEDMRRQMPATRSKHGLPERYFLASARFIEKKNLPRLLEAYARYRVLAEKAEKLEWPGTSPRPSPQSGEGEPPWHLVLLGDGPLRPALNSQLSTLNLHDHVHMPGFKQYPDLPAYYGLAGAFVHASTTEQWGLVVNEAMASGLPVLVSNRCGCAADLVQDGVNGFTFDPYNVEQLAQLMLKVSAFQDVTLSAFGDASKRIVANWGPERFASGLKAAVEKALEVGPMKPTLLQHGLLRLLLSR